MKEAEEQAILRLLSEKPRSLEMLKRALGSRGANAEREKLHDMLLRMRDEGKVTFDIHDGLWRRLTWSLNKCDCAAEKEKQWKDAAIPHRLSSRSFAGV